MGELSLIFSIQYQWDVIEAHWYNVQRSSVRLEIEGSLVRDSLEALCCVIEQDILSSA